MRSVGLGRNCRAIGWIRLQGCKRNRSPIKIFYYREISRNFFTQIGATVGTDPGPPHARRTCLGPLTRGAPRLSRRGRESDIRQYQRATLNSAAIKYVRLYRCNSPLIAHNRIVPTAIAFLRVSTADQKLGLEAQRAAIETYAAAHAIEIVAWHSEIISGGAPLEERTELQTAIADLDVRGAKILIAAKWDRLTRSPTVGVMIEETVRKLGGTIVAADGAGNGSDPAAELFRGMLLLFGQFERRMIGVRTKAALAALKASGRVLGRRSGQVDTKPRKARSDRGVKRARRRLAA
jgi:DNA invertase Pin-like site-specific DNA recombinase